MNERLDILFFRGLSMHDPEPPDRLSTFRLRRRTPGSFLLVPCPKQGRSIRCQGQLEAAAAVILAACPQVAHIQEQPLQTWYAWQGKDDRAEITLLNGPPAGPRKRKQDAGTSYIVPDFLVEMLDGPKHLIEVKPSRRLARPIVQRKLAVGRAGAAQQGWTFHLLTEKELLQGPLLDNVRLLNRYRQGRLDTDVLAQLVSRVPSGGIELSVLLTSRGVESAACLRMHIFHLLAVGRLTCDPRVQPLDDHTLLFPGGHLSWDPFDSLWAPAGSSTGGSGGSSANSHPTALWPKMSSSK
jgi:hypothetical protein